MTVAPTFSHASTARLTSHDLGRFSGATLFDRIARAVCEAGCLPRKELYEAWERLRDTAAEFGEQRIYPSHNSIMFSRKSCYFFVRPKKSFLEVCVFLGRAVRSPRIRRVEPSSKTKFYHIIQVKHRDEVEAPMTDWLREAYDLAGAPPPPKAAAKTKAKVAVKAKATSKRKAAVSAKRKR